MTTLQHPVQRLLPLVVWALACQAPAPADVAETPPGPAPGATPGERAPANDRSPRRARAHVVAGTPSSDTVDWSVNITLPETSAGPRVAEVWLRRGAGLRLVSWESGGAAAAAHKEVVVQERGDQIRVVAYSGANLERLGSGSIATLHFERSAGDASVEVVQERTVFAPADEETP